MDIQGKVLEVLDTVHVSEKFRKRDLILEYADNPEYPETLKIEAHNDKCEKLDELRPGDDVTVSVNLRGRKWTDKNGKDSYFNTIALWKFQVNQTVAGEPVPTAQGIAEEESDGSELPF